MRKGTKVTERNMMAVMGKINRFMASPVYAEAETGRQLMAGSCGVAIHRKKMEEEAKAGVPTSKIDRVFAENSALAIFDDSNGTALPIEVGSRVFISGNQMVITRKCDVLPYYDSEAGRVRNMSFMDRNLTYTFTSAGKKRTREMDEGILKNRLRAVHANLIDDEMFVDSDDMPDLVELRNYRAVGLEFNKQVSEFINGLDMSLGTASFEADLYDACLEEFPWVEGEDTGKFTVKVSIDIDANRNGIDCRSIKMVYGSEEYASSSMLLLDVVCAAADFGEGEEDGEDGRDCSWD